MSNQQDGKSVTLLNLTQAAAAVGITRKTLYKHIQNGRLSLTRDSSDKRAVDVSELIRVYGTVKLPDTKVNAGKQSQDRRNSASDDTGQALQSMQILQNELAQLRELVQGMQRDQQLLLEDAQRKHEQEAELARLRGETEELRRELALARSKGLWARLLGK